MKALLLAILLSVVPVCFADHHHHYYTHGGYYHYGHHHHHHGYRYYYGPTYYYGSGYYYNRPACHWRWDPYYGEYRCFRYYR